MSYQSPLNDVWTLRCMGCENDIVGQSYAVLSNRRNQLYTSHYRFVCPTCDKKSILSLKEVRSVFIMQREGGFLPSQVQPNTPEWVKLGGHGWADKLIEEVVA